MKLEKKNKGSIIMRNKFLKIINNYFWLYRSTLSKRDKNIIVCGAWFGNKYDDNPKYFYEYLTQNIQDVQCYWITKNIEIFKSLKMHNKNVILANSKKAKDVILKAKYICTATGKTDIGEENIKYMVVAVRVRLPLVLSN